MIPKRLQMRNFMCYRQPYPLDLTGIHLACITGDNGHGKSALLDAITWALWGKARGRSDDELVRSGELEMGVEFDFSLGDEQYRVIRKRQLGRRAVGALDLQVKGAGDEYRSLSGATQLATQSRINEVLHLDYVTFINSAMLLQGRADEFTVKAPAERKKILSDILGLSVYDDYEQRAKELAREKEQAVEITRARVAEIDAELARRSEYEREAELAEAEVSKIAGQLRQAEEQLRQLRDRVTVLETQKVQLAATQKRKRASQEQLQGQERRATEYRSKIATAEGVLARRAAIEADHARLQAARQRERDLGLRLSELMTMNDERQRLERRISEAKQQLDVQARVMGRQIEELHRLEEQLPSWRAERDQALRDAADLLELSRRADELRGNAQVLGEQVTELRTRNEALHAEMVGLREDLDLMAQAIAVCPLCRQDMTEAHRDRLRTELTQKGQELGDGFRRNEAVLREHAHTMATIKSELERVDRELKRKGAVDRREAECSHRVAQAEAEVEKLSGLRRDWDALQARLAEGDYAVEEQRALKELEERARSIGYDRSEHEQVRREVVQLAPVEADYGALMAAQQTLAEWTAALEQLVHSSEQLREALRSDEETERELQKQLAEHPALEQQLANTKRQVDQARGEEGHARQVLGAARQKLEHCRYLAGERQERSELLLRLSEERSLYEELQLAFGKKGLQALLIETVIPEIADDANSLLSRMTEGRMSVSFDTQRDKKSGGTIETLDIMVSDELGVRSYEMYSGGEAYRVNLAIRIALSKLLARRAGAQLQTLFIDEGFGTQDAEGRQRLVEAIHTIQDDFSMILVVTHIDELKDAFPVRIDVTKTSEGSQVTIH